MRIDKISHNDVMEQNEDWQSSKFQKTAEGYLTGRAIVTNVGVFGYQDANGNVIRELRPPEEVFAFDSLNSLKLKPVTNNHPTEKITTDNIKEYSVGTCGDSVSTDEYVISVPITITDSKTITDIENGKRALSCGYDIDLEYTPGVWMGVPYDAIQRNIRYNHVSVVDRARAGDLARIRMDGVDVPIAYTEIKRDNKEKSMELKKLQLDGVEYSAEAKVVETIHTLKKDVADRDSKIDSVTNEKTKVEAERDTLKAKLDEAEAKVQVLESTKLDSAAIESIVTERLSVMDSAKEMGAEVNANMTTDEMKKLAIAKILPKLDLADKDSVYISAVFDTCKETHVSQVTVDNAQTVSQPTGVQKTDSMSARDMYIKKLKEEYKNKEGVK